MNFRLVYEKIRQSVNFLVRGFNRANKAVKYLCCVLFCVGCNINTALCSTIWDQSETAGSNFFSHLSTIYYKWWWIVFLLGLIIWLVCKDDKAKGWGKKLAIGSAVIYVIFHLEALFTGSLDGLIQDFGGTTGA